jgi:hypothetical protein
MIVFCVLPVCPCAASVITSVDGCDPHVTDLSAGRCFNSAVPCCNTLSGNLTAHARNAEFREDAIGLAAGFHSDGNPAIMIAVLPYDELSSIVEKSDTIRFLEWQMTRTGGLAAYKAYEVGSTGDLAVTQIMDTVEYEKSAARGNLRAKQIIPGLSEFATSHYFRSHERSTRPDHSGSRPEETRVGAAPAQGQRL